MSLLTARRSSEWIGCIDFGTALSKVALVRRMPRSALSRNEVQPLAVGAGGKSALLLPSVVYITEDQRMVFGDEAQAYMLRGEWQGREAFASPKQYLSTRELRDLSGSLEVGIDPTGKYTPGDLLVLFLAHLLVRSGEAAAKGKLPWPVPLRLARPAWEPRRAAAAEQILQRLLLQACVVADELGSRLTARGGVADGDAFMALSQAQNDPRLEDPAVFSHVFELNSQGSASVLEATAAAAGSIRDAGRRVVMVVDIGGGTSDFGAFLTGLAGNDVLTEIRGSAHVVRQAGDYLDMLLTRHVLERASIHAQDAAARAAASRLRGRQRANKETLFSEGTLHVQLGEDVVTVTLENFLRDPRVSAFADRLSSKFHETLSVAVQCARQYSNGRDHRIPVEILLTGGGHSLPMARSLAAHPSVEWVYAAAAPEIPEGQVSEDFRAVRRQLAVAIGGAVRDLPRTTLKS
jgi:molecular chaperone DnaK (HSP70)